MGANRLSLNYRIFTIGNYCLFVILSLTMLMPILNILAKSLSDKQSIVEARVFFWPVGLHFDNYVSILQSGAMPKAFLITVYITLMGTLLNLIFTGMAAYPLAKPDLKGRSLFMFIIVFTMIFGAPMIPNYLLIKSLGLINSLWSLMIPGLISAFNLILVRTFFMQLPSELFDAARIDGCSEWRILWRIALPLSVPVFVTVGLFYAVGHWNTYQSAILYLNKSDLWTLQVVLRQMIVDSDVSGMAEKGISENILPEGIKSAAVIFATVPILCVYPFLQKYFIKGSLLGSVK